MVHEQEREPTAQTTEGQTESAEPTDLAQLRTALAEATQKSEEYLRLLQRVQADFLNYRRRVEQEREDMLQAARAEAVLALLPWLIVGLIAGWVADKLMGDRFGLIGDLLIGLAGSVIGTALYILLTGHRPGGRVQPAQRPRRRRRRPIRRPTSWPP